MTPQTRSNTSTAPPPWSELQTLNREALVLSHNIRRCIRLANRFQLTGIIRLDEDTWEADSLEELADTISRLRIVLRRMKELE